MCLLFTLKYNPHKYRLQHQECCTVHGILRARILEWVAFPSPGDLPIPRTESRSPTLQTDSLSAEPQGKPQKTGGGNISLLQQIFPTQESNWAFLHCRQILYQLSYQGNPLLTVKYNSYETFFLILKCFIFFLSLKKFIYFYVWNF